LTFTTTIIAGSSS